MSLHPSLAAKDKDQKSRSVMKRSERLRNMLDKGTWKPGDSVYGLPKIKAIRIRIKKEKAEKAAEGATAETAAAPAKEAPAKQAAKGAEKDKK